MSENKKIVEFVTLSHWNEGGLTAKVNHLLKQGWELSGGMVSAGTGGSLLSSGYTTYSQAMVLYEGAFVKLSAVEDQRFKSQIESHSGCLSFIIPGLIILSYLIF